MTDQFDAPASGVKVTEFENCLLLFTPTSHEKDINTAYGMAEAITTDLVVLDGPEAGRQEAGIRVFQKAMMGQLRPKVGTGRKILGRLGKGTAKPGQSAPWLLAEPTEEDKQKAREHLAKADNPPY